MRPVHPQSLVKNGPALQQGVAAHAWHKGDADSDVGLGCGREDHDSVQAEAVGSCDYDPYSRLQCGDRRVLGQEWSFDVWLAQSSVWAYTTCVGTKVSQHQHDGMGCGRLAKQLHGGVGHFLKVWHRLLFGTLHDSSVQ